MIFAAAHGPSALWYATRGAGATTLVLLTVSLALGIIEVRGLQPAGAPRFAYAALHRTVSLMALTLLVVHVVTTLLDPYPTFGVMTAFLPFSASYRPLWVGFGTLASDLLVALVLTSLLRRRLGYRVWRLVHWTAYACWPLALLHGLGTGSDIASLWMRVLALACIGTILVAVTSRIAARGTSTAVRVGGVATMLFGTIALAAWAQQGPLKRGWARRAGTPPSVLAAFRPAPQPVRPAVRARPSHPPPPPRAFRATLQGTVDSGRSAGGEEVIDLRMRLHQGPNRVLRIRIGGVALPSGGVRMRRSAVTFGPPWRPREYRGRVQVLTNDVLQTLVGTADGRALRLHIALSLSPALVRGTITGTPVLQ